MLKLRFINLYNVNKSPLQLSYQNNDMDVMGNDAALVMRFTKPYAINTSPLTMRFGDDTGPVDPTLPILQANIGIESELSWLIPPLITQAQVLEYQTESVKNELKTTFNSAELVPVVFSIKSKLAALFTEQKSVEWGNSGYILNTIQIPYKIITSIEYHENDFNWLTDLNIEHTEFKSIWNSSELIKTASVLHWHVKPLLELRELVFHYGETDKQYICYWRNHQFKGYVNLEFTKPAQLHNGRLVMSFNNPDKVCYWGLPGGLVRGDDDVPTLDRKISIEPQLRKTYFMNNAIECVRVSDGQKVLISSFNYQLSRAQFAATSSVSFCSRIDSERAQDQLLKITVNGYDFFVHVETPSVRQKFNANSYSATGRSRMAELSAPFISAKNYTNSTAKTLAGLMSDIVTNTGWSIDNQMIDYAVPALAFSYQNKTPAEALSMCANAIGGMLVFNDEMKVISLIPKWPVMPWDTESAVCDVIINESVILEHNQQKTSSPTSNAVFVRGEQQGVSCKVKRAGTLADKFASDVVEQLITHVQAARQRGSCELAETGNKYQSNIRTKIMADLPPIMPGMLVGIRYGTDIYKATADSLSISASVSSTGLVSVNQTFTVLKNE